MPRLTKIDEDKILQAKKVVDAARDTGIVLRLIGGLAVRHHCTITFFCEREYLDIDFVGIRKQATRISHLFKMMNYTEKESVWLASGGNRMQFYMNGGLDHVDVFLDTLRMDHDLVLKKRLFIENYTISVSDLLLSKLTIYRLNEKDIRDTLTLVKDLGLGEDDKPGVINVKYIAELCSKKWGLYVDVLNNIDKCIELMDKYNLTAEEVGKVRDRLVQIKRAIENEPKTMKWKLRKIVGRRMRWRRTVEDQDAAT